MLNFTKMNGAGNDFVMLDNRDGSLSLDKARIAQLCNRHRGVGGDGLLVVEPAQNGADFRMRYYNSDGGEAEMCGNGARCFARFAHRISEKKGAISFETMAGVIVAEFIGENVRIQMSEPHSLALDATLNAAGTKLAVHSLNTGVPHAIVFVDDLETVDARKLGHALRFHPHFAPKGTNVNFVKPPRSGIIAIRTYERGVEDETLACGTGVVACALISHEKLGLPSPVRVKVRGGDTLEIAWRKDGATYRDVTLTGPADFTFDGRLPA